ncbi:MAG: hypothetical protein PHG66_04515 [Candidatus Colwellbacteria bacterium]|nr:hypothetical protein [Candidatus Colwellbacteria bacterium]
MSELLKSKHMLCALIGLVVVAGVLVFMSWTPKNVEGNCGCAQPGQYEGYVSPALRSMAENNKRESLYKPKERLINYAKPPERFVPAPGNSMKAQMNSMRGSPVAKSMNSMAQFDPQSPFINYSQ